jgi:hypothetical protein
MKKLIDMPGFRHANSADSLSKENVTNNSPSNLI